MVKHILLLKVIEDEQTADNLEQIKEDLLTVADEANGLVSAEVGYNYSDADYDLVFTASFKNPAALKHFQTNPKYLKVNKFIESVCESSSHVDFMSESDNIINKTDAVANEKKASAQKKNNSVTKTTKTTKSTPKTTAKSTAKAAPKTVAQPIEIESGKETAPTVKINNHVLPHIDEVHPTPEEYVHTANIREVEQVTDEPVIVKPIVSEQIVTEIIEPVNTTATNNIAEDNIVVKRIEPKGTTIKDGESAMEEAWRCPVCNKINGAFVGICGCGADRPAYYTPLSPQQVEQARIVDTPHEEANSLPFLKNSVLLPSIDEFVETFKPTITKTVNAIKRSAGEDVSGYDEKEADDTELTAAARAAANLDAEEKIDVIKIEPKGKQIKDGESAMKEAWKCPVCNKINGAFVGICGCGVHRPDEYTPVPLEEIKAQAQEHKSSESTTNLTPEIDAYEQLIHSKKSQPLKSLSEALNSVKSKSIQTITEAMNNAEASIATSNTDKFIKKKTKKAPSYNSKLLSTDEDASLENKTIRIEPKGSQPRNGESAMKNSWICPKCGKENASYIGQCGCGCQKSLTKEFA